MSEIFTIKPSDFKNEYKRLKIGELETFSQLMNERKG